SVIYKNDGFPLEPVQSSRARGSDTRSGAGRGGDWSRRIDLLQQLFQIADLLLDAGLDLTGILALPDRLALLVNQPLRRGRRRLGADRPGFDVTVLGIFDKSANLRRDFPELFLSLRQTGKALKPLLGRVKIAPAGRQAPLELRDLPPQG